MNKKNLVFLDTETTGTGPDGRLCQLAYKHGGKERVSFFKPPVPIEVEAMSISHITNRMVADKEPFLNSPMYNELREILSKECVLVAHNAGFDAEILKREGIVVGKFIDTWKIAQHLDPELKIPKYNLQYLRYYFDLEIENAPAHDAMGDVRVLEKLFNHFFGEMLGAKGNEKNVLDEMIEISSRPVFLKKFTFGKYIGELIENVARKDPGYIEWLRNEKLKTRGQGGENDENWIYTLEYYLG